MYDDVIWQNALSIIVVVDQMFSHHTRKYVNGCKNSVQRNTVWSGCVILKALRLHIVQLIYTEGKLISYRVINFISKVAQLFGDYLGYFENITF